MRRPETSADQTVVNAVDAVWQRLQRDFGVPPAEFFLTNAHNSGCSSAWDDRPLAFRLNLQENGPGQGLPLEVIGLDKDGKEIKRRTPEDILLQLLHLAAHSLATTPTQGGSEGRYHRYAFSESARALGVQVTDRDSREWSAGQGFAIDFAKYDDPNSPAWDELRRPKYWKRELERLEAIREWQPSAALRPRQRGPVRMRCACTPETIKAGLRKRGLPEDTGLSEDRRGRHEIAAPKVINVSTGVAARGGIWCPDCKTEFMLSD